MANFPETRISLILRLGEISDVQAWQEFAEIYAPALHRLARRKGLQSADAEDVTQEILFGVARAIERFEPDRGRARFRTWLSRIARNLIADFCAGKGKRPLSQALSDQWLEAATEQASGHRSSWDEEFAEERRRAIFELAASRVRTRVSEVTWQAFERTSLKKESAERLAKELGVALGSIYVHRCRVLKMLREEVQQIERSYEESNRPESGAASATDSQAREVS